MRPSPFHKGSGAQSKVDVESISDLDKDSEVGFSADAKNEFIKQYADERRDGRNDVLESLIMILKEFDSTKHPAE